MIRRFERTEAQKRLVKKAKDYIRSIYENLGTLDFRYFDGCFRGFIHALGTAEIINHETEFNICKIDFCELKKRRALVMVDFMLDSGFEAIQNGQKSLFDNVYEEAQIDE